MFLSFIEILLNLKCVPFSAGQNNKKKQILIEIVNSISFHTCIANEIFFLIF